MGIVNARTAEILVKLTEQATTATEIAENATKEASKWKAIAHELALKACDGKHQEASELIEEIKSAHKPNPASAPEYPKATPKDLRTPSYFYP